MRLSDGTPRDEQVVMDRAIGRVRDVAIAPDGSILLLNDEASGGVWRISR